MRKKMKLFRLANFLTQKELAERLGFSPAQVALIERGESDGTLRFWREFQKALNVSDAEMWSVISENK